MHKPAPLSLLVSASYSRHFAKQLYRRQEERWLTSCVSLLVKEAVLHLDQAPFLQLQRGRQTSQHPVDESIVQNPQVRFSCLQTLCVTFWCMGWRLGLRDTASLQLWKTFSGYLADKNAEMVMLVHPLSAPGSEMPGRSATNSEAVITGITASAMHQRRLLSVAELVRSGATTADFSGQVGDCCEDEELVSQVPLPLLQYILHEL